MKKWKKILLGLILVPIMLVSASLIFEYFSMQKFVARASGVILGQTKQEVEQIMGKPPSYRGSISSEKSRSWVDAVFPDTWCYEPFFDWKHAFHKEWPFFWPFSLHLFSCDPRGVAIEFNWSGKVQKVLLPQ